MVDDLPLAELGRREKCSEADQADRKPPKFEYRAHFSALGCSSLLTTTPEVLPFEPPDANPARRMGRR